MAGEELADLPRRRAAHADQGGLKTMKAGKRLSPQRIVPSENKTARFLNAKKSAAGTEKL